MSSDDARPSARAHHLVGPEDTQVGRWLRAGEHLLGGLRPIIGPFPALISKVTAPAELLAAAEAGIPPGPAAAEAIAVRLRRAGVAVTCHPTGTLIATRRELTAACRERGRHAVHVWRCDPDLVTQLRIGSWFVGGWRTRAIRRAALLGRAPLSRLPLRAAVDASFWMGVRDEATTAEWQRLTRSYVVLCYHRLAGIGLPGQERWDVAPRALNRQLRLLRLLRWQPLSPEELLRLHDTTAAAVPRRRYVITVDDGFRDAVAAFRRHGVHRPQFFAVTSAVGGRADWFGDVSVAGWSELRDLQATGATVGSHARHHVRLADATDATIDDEVAGSLFDLRSQLDSPSAVLAYPHGSHDDRVRAAAIRGGYGCAFATQQGRNGIGTDRWCLRRVEPKIWDSTLSFAWKVITGESPPAAWEQHLQRRWRAASRRR